MQNFSAIVTLCGGGIFVKEFNLRSMHIKYVHKGILRYAALGVLGLPAILCCPIIRDKRRNTERDRKISVAKATADIQRPETQRHNHKRCIPLGRTSVALDESAGQMGTMCYASKTRSWLPIKFRCLCSWFCSNSRSGALQGGHCSCSAIRSGYACS
jgi:hypothetical protein